MPLPAPQRHKNVLVVDDEQDIREAVCLILGDAGYATHEASTGKEALDLLDDGLVPEAIVLDLMMPVMTGWQLLDLLRRDPARAQIPVIIMSASSEKPPTPYARYLQKPFDLDELLAVVQKYAG